MRDQGGGKKKGKKEKKGRRQRRNGQGVNKEPEDSDASAWKVT